MSDSAPKHDHRNDLRISMKNRRRALQPSDVLRASLQLAEQLDGVLNHTDTIGVYAPAQGEISLLPFLTTLPASMRIAWPKSQANGQMHFVQAKVEELRQGRFGIFEPSFGPILEPSALGAIFVPGTAFTLQGGRLGMGGGYYDRYLEDVPATTWRVGVAYHWQIVDTLPLFPHDKRMTHLATDAVFTSCEH